MNGKFEETRWLSNCESRLLVRSYTFAIIVLNIRFEPIPVKVVCVNLQGSFMSKSNENTLMNILKNLSSKRSITLNDP